MDKRFFIEILKEGRIRFEMISKKDYRKFINRQVEATLDGFDDTLSNDDIISFAKLLHENLLLLKVD